MEEEEEEREDEKGPESGVGTKEGDEKEDAERRRRSLASRLLSIFPLSLSLLCFILCLFLSPSRRRLVPSLPWTSSAPPQSIFRLPIRRSKSLEEKRRRGYAVLIIVVVFFFGDRLFSVEIICHRARAIIRYSPLLSLYRVKINLRCL